MKVMSNDNTASKPMTVKSWLRKSDSKVSADAFLKASRVFLETGELSQITSPILRQVDQGLLFPTPALTALRDVILAHHLQVEVKKAEAKIAEQSAEGTTAKTWEVICYNAKGVIQTRITEQGETVDLQQSFDVAQRASEWADRRLVLDCASDCFAVITHLPTGRETISLRNEAFARIYPKAKSPFSKKVGTRDNRLSFGTKVKESHAKFSHG
jgi:hypothetical protein